MQNKADREWKKRNYNYADEHSVDGAIDKQNHNFYVD